jgi:hypothetical protein
MCEIPSAYDLNGPCQHFSKASAGGHIVVSVGQPESGCESRVTCDQIIYRAVGDTSAEKHSMTVSAISLRWRCPVGVGQAPTMLKDIPVH